MAYQEKKQFDRAIQDFDQAARLDPNDATAFASRGDAYMLVGAFDRAMSDYDQAVRLDPRSATNFYSRGLAYSSKGQWRRAIEDYNEAMTKSRPRSPFMVEDSRSRSRISSISPYRTSIE